MSEYSSAEIRAKVDEVYRTDSRRVFATLVRLIGDFDLAEEAMHEAFAAAVEQWHRDGIPANPRSWLVSVGRFKAIDHIRRRVRFDEAQLEVAQRLEGIAGLNAEKSDTEVEDDRLRLIFTCCHPAIAPQVQIPLTLREVCGLSTEEIASAFLTSPSTMAQRIVRGKSKIRDAGIPYVVPNRADLPERLDAVLTVVYLVFNEGYSASSGDSLTRKDLSEEAIRLGRLLLDLLEDPEVKGLLALMLIHESRREARSTTDGDLILLEDQDRSLWDQEKIREGTALVGQAIASGEVGSYTIQAAIASAHAVASRSAETDWSRIVSWYNLLLQANPTPIIELNRAVAIAMRDGAEAGLQLIDEILIRGDLKEYHLIYAARADLCRRLGQIEAARAAYEKALSLTNQTAESRFLEKRLQELAQIQAQSP
ncbi:MAG: RNA polymerase subunit sigma-24 [Gimesia sp.]|uniref:RNA polymerase subunit sigma-24 n=1 Tax=Gimesia maris TaxID=122 RepID=A0A3D3RA54_9PLAN|nr:RNA polymerase subunit sigma-24 [Gimesia sp.]HCO24958.1 RNA polymerase subunit sigma-24 [Gimesia maris]|tara:strand:- start:20583 stop:21854 length:1272 start_codon:yes stop_codon:yes gene_type:complete